MAEKSVFFTNIPQAKTVSLSKKVYLGLIAGEVRKGRCYNTSINSNRKALLIPEHFKLMFGKQRPYKNKNTVFHMGNNEIVSCIFQINKLMLIISPRNF